MKYILDKIYISPDETPSGLRKVVADKLGVRASSLRVNVIRRRWWRGKEGGMLEVRVEAETAEFIHNTAALSYEDQSVSLPESHSKLRPVVVGFGVRGAIAAFLLAKQGFKPIVLEQGLPGPSSDKAKPVAGDGGLFALTGMLFTPDNLDAPLRKALAEEGITFDLLDAFQAFPPAFVKSLVTKLRTYVTNNGGDFIYGAKYLGPKYRFGRFRGVIYEESHRRVFLRTSAVILAEHSCDDAFFVGSVIETPLRAYNQFIYDRPTVDRKLPTYVAHVSCVLPSGEKARLVVGMNKSSVLPYQAGPDCVLHAPRFDGKGDNAFHLLMVPVPESVYRQTQKTVYCASRPYSIPYDLVSDFLDHRNPLRLGIVKPYGTSAVRLAAPDKYFNPAIAGNLEKALYQFGKAFPFLLQDSGIIGGTVFLSGNKAPEEMVHPYSGVFVSAIAPEQSMDFASVASASYKAFVAFCKTTK